MSRFLISATLAITLFAIGISPSLAQTPPPTSTPPPQDLALFGFPTVAISQTVQPDQSVTLTTGGQSLTIPAGAYAVPVRFDFLTGDNAKWQKTLDDSSDTVVTNFAFRVTDIATNKLIGRSDKPLGYRYDGPLITKDAKIHATSATTPPKLLELPSENNLIAGKTISRSFSGSGVGWFISVPNESPGSSSALTLVIAIGGGLVLLVAGIVGARMLRRKT